MDAIALIAKYGHLFLRYYRWNMTTGEWTYDGFQEKEEPLSIDCDFVSSKIDLSNIDNLRKGYRAEAERLAKELQAKPKLRYRVDSPKIEEIKFFHYQQ